MKRSVLWGFGAAAALASLLVAESSARACGGCFGPPGPSTQVTAHRMAFAISPQRTILWDQIQYAGDPTSFAWVLPIRQAVDVGVSSDELFQRLEQYTQPQINQPTPPTCPAPQQVCRTTCGGYDDGAGTPTEGAADAAVPVDVWSQQVVGPYEATQLSSTDSTALRDWLGNHGYQIPTAIDPVIDEYVKEGFGFIAIKLVPNAGTSAMVPIRIAFDGASPQLPLRMVAAGTGDNVGVKLFVLGEGRWDTSNFPTAEVPNSALVWDWGAMGSNFGTLENNLVTADPRTWIAETSDDYAISNIADGLPPGTTQDDSGTTIFSSDTDSAELAKAFPSRTNVTVTRLFAQLPQTALDTDLQLAASTGGKIPQSRTPTQQINYSCPTQIEVDCAGVTPTCGYGDPGYPGNPSLGGGSTGKGGGNAFGCAVQEPNTSKLPWIGLGVIGLVAINVVRRRLSK